MKYHKSEIKKWRKRKWFRPSGQGLYDDLARLEGSVLQVERPAYIALNLESVSLEGDAPLVLLALGQFQLCDSFRGCHVETSITLFQIGKWRKGKMFNRYRHTQDTYLNTHGSGMSMGMLV